MSHRAAIEATTRALLAKRCGKSACPSEVARLVAPDHWRDLMPEVREVAAAMPDVVLTQHGEPVEAGAKGPIRLAPRG